MKKKNDIKTKTIKVGDHVFYNTEDKNLFGKDFIVIDKEGFTAEIIESNGISSNPKTFKKTFEVPLSDLYRKNAFSVSDKISFCDMEGTVTKISFDEMSNQFYYQISLPRSTKDTFTSSYIPESFLLSEEDINSDYKNIKNENYKSKDVVRIKSFRDMRKEYPLKRFGFEIPCSNTPTRTLTFTHGMKPFTEKVVQLKYHPYCEGTFSIRTRNLDPTISSLKDYPWAFTEGMFKKRLNEFRCKDNVLFYSKHCLNNEKKYLVTYIRDILYKNGIIEYLIGISIKGRNELLFWVTSKDIIKYTMYLGSIRDFLKKYRNDSEENYIIDMVSSTGDKIKGNVYLTFENDKDYKEFSNADLIGKFEIIVNQYRDTIINIYSYCYNDNTFTLIGRGEAKYNPEDGYSRIIGLSIAGKKIKKIAKDISSTDKIFQIADYIKSLPMISSNPKLFSLFLNCYESLITAYTRSSQETDKMTDAYKAMLLEIESILSNAPKIATPLLQQIQKDLKIDSTKNETSKNEQESLVEYLKKIMK